MSVAEKRNKIIDYTEQSEEYFNDAYGYLNENLIQCNSFQFESIVSNPSECCDDYIEELYGYLFGQSE